MSDLYKFIEELCESKGVNITQMCREANVTRSALSELKQGRTETLSAQNQTKIANYFSISTDSFEKKKIVLRAEDLFYGKDRLDDMLSDDDCTKKFVPIETNRDEMINILSNFSEKEIDELINYADFIAFKRNRGQSSPD